ncbi:MAG: hypothetical protein JWL83_1928 [Actinomycetia bacterium]|jgi:Tat protein translocase TatB subunit|nr:hypothetical protein [Actinomycetes bacterium]
MNLGPAEILVILLVALVVFGPKRLPEVGRQVGGAMRELRRMQDSMRTELSSVLNDDHPDVGEPYAEDHTIHSIEGDRDHDDGRGALPPVSHLDDPDSGPSGSFS